jgi:hypothetical protein
MTWYFSCRYNGFGLEIVNVGDVLVDQVAAEHQAAEWARGNLAKKTFHAQNKLFFWPFWRANKKIPFFNNWVLMKLTHLSPVQY